MSNREFRIIMEAIQKLMDSIEASKTAETDEDFLDSHRMERLLRCSPATLYRLRKNGQIPCTMYGGKYIYPKNYFTREVLASLRKPEDPSKRFDDV